MHAVPHSCRLAVAPVARLVFGQEQREGDLRFAHLRLRWDWLCFGRAAWTFSPCTRESWSYHRSDTASLLRVLQVYTLATVLLDGLPL